MRGQKNHKFLYQKKFYYQKIIIKLFFDFIANKPLNNFQRNFASLSQTISNYATKIQSMFTEKSSFFPFNFYINK